MVDEFYIPAPERIRKQDSFNIQGSSDEEVPAELQQKVITLIEKDCGDTYADYRTMLEDGVSRELARINLPLTLYTEWYWQIDLHNLFHFLKLRMDTHAQWEIQQYANALAKIAQAVAPWAYESFEEHILHGRNFSGSEIEALKAMIGGEACPLEGRVRKEFFIKMGLEDEQNKD
jgi:thymidylate synthase (FAD)